MPPPDPTWQQPAAGYGYPVAQYPAAPADRLRAAVTQRNTTDYVFAFWTALGWTILTCGIFGYFVIYQMFKRSVDHNLRRIEVLDSLTALAWERAYAAGRGEELTPHFHAIGAQINEMRRVAAEFRDPALWTLISAFTGGIGQILGYVFLDQDLCAHEAAERSAEEQLAGVLGALGMPVNLPAAPAPKQRHNVGGRVVALLASCGVYGLWWQYDLMEEGNANYRNDWAREDALLQAVGA